MKRLILISATASFVFFSCGKSDVCNCVDLSVSHLKEVRNANNNETKLNEIEKKYKDDFAVCRNLEKGKSEAEMKNLMTEAKKCDGYSEWEKMMKNIMK
jgi:hypothetical protein